MTIKNDTLRLNLISSCIGAFLGLTFLLAPDLFWNPGNGWMPFKFLTRTRLPDSSGHLDPVVRAMLRGTGSCMASLGLFHLLISKPQHQEALLRYKLLLLLSQAAVFVHSMIFSRDSGIFVANVLWCLVAYNLVTAAWLWQDYKKTNPNPAPLVSSKPWTLSALVGFVYALPFSILFLLDPQEFGPKGRIPYFAVPVPQDAVFDEAQLLSIRLLGATLLAWVFEVYDNRSAPIAELTMMNACLYSLSYLDAALDNSGYTNQVLNGIKLAFHYLFITFLAFELSRENTSMKGMLKSGESQMYDEKTEVIPNLTAEERKIGSTPCEKKTN